MPDEPVSQDMLDAMTLLGWRAPTTDDACAALLAHIDRLAASTPASSRVTPASIRAALTRTATRQPLPPIQFPAPAIERFRAAARRDHADSELELPPEIREQMARDRAQAEREKDQRRDA